MQPPSPAVCQLAAAYRAVLLDDFEEQFHALSADRPWYAESLPADELFRLWVLDMYYAEDGGEWVFQPIRSGERVRLCEALGIPKSNIVGLTARNVANLILAAAGLPVAEVADLKRESESWLEAIMLVDRAEDEKASVLFRQLGERILKRTLLFHCAAGQGPLFLSILRDPKTLRVPPRLLQVTRAPQEKADAALVDALAEDGWADLGFLAFALRRLSLEAEAAGVTNITGERLVLFLDSEFGAFLELAAALQAYVHDKPSLIKDRRPRLRAAAQGAFESLGAMIRRRVIPEEALVLQKTESVFGLLFHGYYGGSVRILACDALPLLGRRVLFVVCVDRDYSMARWVPSPFGA